MSITFLVWLLCCLAYTIIVEEITALIMGVRNKYDLLMILGINCITNPLLSTIMTQTEAYGLNSMLSVLVIMEGLIFYIEGKMFAKYLDYKNPYLLSLILNLASFIVGGLLLQYVPIYRIFGKLMV